MVNSLNLDQSYGCVSDNEVTNRSEPYKSKTTQTTNHAPWWRHQTETFSALLDVCEGTPLVNGGIPSQRPVTRSFDVFFDLRLNKRLSKQSRRRWFETPLHSLWRHCNAILLTCTVFTSSFVSHPTTCGARKPEILPNVFAMPIIVPKWIKHSSNTHYTHTW